MAAVSDVSAMPKLETSAKSTRWKLREISWATGRESCGPRRGCPGKMQLKYLKTILQADDGIKKVTAITW